MKRLAFGQRGRYKKERCYGPFIKKGEGGEERTMWDRPRALKGANREQRTYRLGRAEVNSVFQTTKTQKKKEQIVETIFS